MQSLIRYKALSQFNELVHFTTTRLASGSDVPGFKGFPSSEINNNFQKPEAITGIRESQFVFPEQTHSANIHIVKSLDKKIYPDTDALITDRPGICICIRTADCVPIFIYDPYKKVCAIVHAGWRGTVKQIALNTVRELTGAFFSDPENLIVILGPCISAGVYEVGEDVISEVKRNIPSPEKVLTSCHSHKSLLDLRGANKNLLTGAGLRDGNIIMTEFCTFTDSRHFYSSRREGNRTGRMISGMMLKKKV